jgi:hypothetical protein
MAEELGQCRNQTCAKAATRVAVLVGQHRETGEWHRIEQPTCDEHYADITAPCAEDSCKRRGPLVIEVNGRRIGAAAPQTGELRLCEEHWNAMQNAAVLTLNGVTMVGDGHGNLKALPKNIGHG